jgi:hypothetical protein
VLIVGLPPGARPMPGKLAAPRRGASATYLFAVPEVEIHAAGLRRVRRLRTLTLIAEPYQARCLPSGEVLVHYRWRVKS